MSEFTPLRATAKDPSSIGSLAAAILAAGIAFGCVPASESLTAPRVEPLVTHPTITASTFSRDGTTLYWSDGANRCTLKALVVASRESRVIHELAFCPSRLTSLDDGSILAADDTRSEWVGADGALIQEGRTILAALDADHFLERTSGGLELSSGDTVVALDQTELRNPRIAAGGFLLGIETGAEGERLVRFDGPGATGITPTFEKIDSWDVAPRGDELAFSAKVESGHDIGIVGVSGGEITWVAPDPADERNVTWAPRGNKITYTFESVDATLVRSVHVPTSFQVMFEMPLTTVRQIAWEPHAERIALVIDSPTVGPRIDWVGYNGEGRENLVEAIESVDAPVESVLWSDGSGVLLGPGVVRYDQSQPTVFWIEPGDPFAWRADVARLRGEGVPVLVTTRPRIGDLSTAVSQFPWVGPTSLYIADVSGGAIPGDGKIEKAKFFVRQAVDGSAQGEVEVVYASDVAFRAEVARRILSEAVPAR